MSKTVSTLPLLHIDGSVATITLNRPARRNSLGDDDLRALLAHFDAINANLAVQAVMLTANTSGQPKPVFCAGYHVSGFESDEHDPNFFEQIPDALERLRPISICAMNGSVYGGATDLMLACDLRLGLFGAELRMPAAALGLHYYPSGLRRYVSRLGLNLAKRAFLTGKAIPLEALQSANLFEALLSADDFDAGVQACVQGVLSMAPLAMQSTKASLNELAAGHYHEEALRAREVLTANSRDFAEGRQAFAERRPARFEGR
jgi:enoyl-CoA hydratase/carnithine racemase